MVDRINRLFAMLARPSSYKYVYLGVISSLLFYFLEPQNQKPLTRQILFAGSFALLMTPLLTRLFYERYELGRKNLSAWGLFVEKDNFFYTKIRSDISNVRKTFGYLYVLFRIVSATFLGFLFTFPLLVLLDRSL